MTNPAYLCDRILLTNDDGIDAPGLAVLGNIAETLAREVWVVAPVHDQSGTSHAISLHQPLRVVQRHARRYAVTGTPGDCVAMALGHLMRDNQPDLILSGVNRGANLGIETVFSGTVGAAMTGMLMGVPSFAMSQAFTDRAHIPWQVAADSASDVIRHLYLHHRTTKACLNINFPVQRSADHPLFTFTRQGKGYLKGISVTAMQDPRALDYYWLALSRHQEEDYPDAESTVLREGGITVTPLQFERTAKK